MNNKIKLPIIIAECGNNHEGNFANAAKMMQVAHRLGADLVKFQAGNAKDFARNKEQIPFYKRFELGLSNYIKLFELGKKLKIPVFFSIWGKEFNILRKMQKYHKIPARQCNDKNIKLYDSPTTFISIPHNMDLKNIEINKGIPMHVVSEYPLNYPYFDRIERIRDKFKTVVGYSDHSVGIANCIKAFKEYKALVIEKHFTLSYYTSDFRDHKLSADPTEFFNLVNQLKYNSINKYYKEFAERFL